MNDVYGFQGVTVGNIGAYFEDRNINKSWEPCQSLMVVLRLFECVRYAGRI